MPQINADPCAEADAELAAFRSPKERTSRAVTFARTPLARRIARIVIAILGWIAILGGFVHSLSAPRSPSYDHSAIQATQLATEGASERLLGITWMIFGAIILWRLDRPRRAHA